VIGGEDESLAVMLELVAEAQGDHVIDLEGLDGGAADADGILHLVGVPVALGYITGAAVGVRVLSTEG
jgi:hypothetical protein